MTRILFGRFGRTQLEQHPMASTTGTMVSEDGRKKEREEGGRALEEGASRVAVTRLQYTKKERLSLVSRQIIHHEHSMPRMCRAIIIH